MDADIRAAYVVQGIASVAAIGAALWLAWSGRPALRNAAAIAAAVIATPYALDYDLVVLLAALCFLWKDGEAAGWRPWEETLLAFVWVAPLFGRAVAGATFFPLGLAASVTILALAVRRGLRTSPSRHSREGSGR